ncbi:MAG: alkaline phosphatase family protein [Actinomycetota bacterium]|nr:alkaline phosphatase family protein [Actinomycetota bacterium]
MTRLYIPAGAKTAMPDLVLGPLLRYTSETEATVWVETGSACEVEVSTDGSTHRSGTFHIEGHHYALVHVPKLESGRTYGYEVLLNGERKWPEDGSPFPPSVIRPVARGVPLRLAFGSCRICAPHEPPYTLTNEEDERGLRVDALYALAVRLREEPVENLPHALLLLGDQIYAHKPPFETLDFIHSRRDTDKPPGEEVASFEEYARLYRDSWSDPAIRWLLSTVPSAMVFDDHEVSDDWNISESWIEEVRTHPWWNDQITGGHVSYWIYQHLGNISPRELAKNDLFEKVKAAGDAGPILREFAYRTHRETAGTRWSFYRDFGGTRLVMMDSRGGRVLERGHRSMVDADEWQWIVDHATGDFDHLLLGSSLPVLLGPGMHHLQAWNETICSGAWGQRATKWGERIRRSQDLDHWGSFHKSFIELTDLIRSVGAGERGRPPASILILSGDVHHGYLARAAFHSGRVKSRVYQAVCSPLRNALPGKKARLQSAAWSKPGELAGRFLSRLVGVEKEEVSWRLTHRELWFENQIATLKLEDQRATLIFEKAILDGSGEPNLRKIYEHCLA